MSDTFNVVLAALVSGGVVAALTGVVLRLLFDKRLASIAEEVRAEFERAMVVYRSDREWREQAVAELLGPVVIQLDRSGRAFDRWRERNVYIETKVMRDGNTAIRDLLIAKPHLLPPDLLEAAGRLIEHYDRWLEEYDRVRGDGDDRALDEPFVFVGPKGYPFPTDAERAFRATYTRMWNELYAPAG